MVEQYTLKVLIDDSKIKELEQRLGKLGGGSSSGTAQRSGGGLASLFGGQSGAFKNLGKLAGIAIGVGALVKLVQKISSLVVDSSPMLKGMFKLFNTSIMMIFRPIGDFIGFFLRPIVIFFLRNIALPWYRLAAPIMRQWGSTIGNAFVEFLKNPLGSLVGLITGINWVEVLKLTPIGQLLGLILKVLESFNLDLGEISSGISDRFKNLMAKASEFLVPIITDFINGMNKQFSGVVSFFGTLWTGTKGALGAAWEGISGFFNKAWESITNTFQPAWDALTGIWQSLVDFFKPIFEFFQKIVDFFTGGREEDEHTSFSGTGAADARGNRGETTIYIIDSNGTQTPGSVSDVNPSVLNTIQNTKRNSVFR